MAFWFGLFQTDNGGARHKRRDSKDRQRAAIVEVFRHSHVQKHKKRTRTHWEVSRGTEFCLYRCYGYQGVIKLITTCLFSPKNRYRGGKRKADRYENRYRGILQAVVTERIFAFGRDGFQRRRRNDRRHVVGGNRHGNNTGTRKLF